jgi:hypothetical protein
VIRRAAALGLLLAATARAGGAQRLPEFRIEAGYASVWQRGFDPEAAALLAVFWREPRERWTFLTSGNLTYAQDSLAAAQGVAAIDVPWPGTERVRTEIGVAGASFSLRSEGRGGNGNVFLRQHVVGSAGGSWIGAGLGRTGRDGIASSSAQVDAGVWYRLGPAYVSTALARTSSADWPLLLASGVLRDPTDERFDLLDVLVTAQLRNGPHDLTLAFTARNGLGSTDAHFRALLGSATVQVTERAALLLVGGQQLADPLRGLPQAGLVTVSARVSLGPQPLPVMERSAIAQAQVLPMAGGGGELVVRVLAADTMFIQVAGDFSEWQPLPMEREGATWVARRRLPPGKYRVAVSVNHGVWRAPRNLARVRDDYGGEAGLVVIP